MSNPRRRKAADPGAETANRREAAPVATSTVTAAPKGAALALLLCGVIGSLLTGLVAAAPFEFGFSSSDQLPTVVLWLAAGICALGLALGAQVPRHWVRNPLMLGLCGMIATTVLLAPFAAYPLMSFTGSMQNGEGGLRLLAMLALIVAVWRLLREIGRAHV